MAGKQGVGSSKTILMDGETINDPYNLTTNTAAIHKQMQEDSDDENAGSSILKVYDESKNKTESVKEEMTKLDEVKLKEEEDNTASGDKPMIQEVGSMTFSDNQA